MINKFAQKLIKAATMLIIVVFKATYDASFVIDVAFEVTKVASNAIEKIFFEGKWRYDDEL